MFVYYKGANQHSVSAGPKFRVVLNPGRNEVDDNVWAAIEKTAKDLNEKGGITRLKKEGMILVFKTEAEHDAAMSGDAEVLDISEMNQKNAIEVVDAEVSDENLLDFIDQETNGKKREKVLEAINARIDLLSGPDGASNA